MRKSISRVLILLMSSIMILVSTLSVLAETAGTKEGFDTSGKTASETADSVANDTSAGENGTGAAKKASDAAGGQASGVPDGQNGTDGADNKETGIGNTDDNSGIRNGSAGDTDEQNGGSGTGNSVTNQGAGSDGSAGYQGSGADGSEDYQGSGSDGNTSGESGAQDPDGAGTGMPEAGTKGSDEAAVLTDAAGTGAQAAALPGDPDTGAIALSKANAEETSLTYTIKFAANGGSGTMDPVTVTAASEGASVTYKLPPSRFTAPAGKGFKEWQTEISGKKVSYKAGDSISITGDVTLTAVWVKVYTVTFTDGIGKTPKTLKTQTVNSGEAATAPKDPTRSQYHFNGWNKSFDKVTSNMTVKATWHQNHKYGKWKITKKPTYFKTGRKVRKCSCGAKETAKAAKLKARKEWVKEDGKRYYFGSNRKPVTGWNKVKHFKSGTKKWCYFTKKGVYVKSIDRNTRDKWVSADGKKFYFTSSKKPAGAGFNYIGDRLYFMKKNGALKIGKVRDANGNKYTTNSDGSITGVDYYRYRYGSFVLVDISDQRIWYYQNGRLALNSDVVTGNRGSHDTPTGIFSVRSKQRDIYLVGSTWRSHVDYWMAFIGSSYGLHDASWRTSGQFSNHSTYRGNGSHGCINLRPSFAGTLYSMVSVGTPVIVQN